MKNLHYNPCPVAFHALGELCAYVELDSLAVALDVASPRDLECWHELLTNAVGGDYPDTPPQGAEGLAEARFLVRIKWREALEDMASGSPFASPGGYAYNRAERDNGGERAPNFANLADRIAIAIRHSLPGGFIYRPCFAADKFLHGIAYYTEADRLAAGLDAIPATGIVEAREQSRNASADRGHALRQPNPGFPRVAGGAAAYADDSYSVKAHAAFSERLQTLRAAVLDSLPTEAPPNEE